MATPPVPTASRDSSGGVISRSLKVEGSISGAADLLVDGQISGEIHLEENALTVGSNGVVDANVKAREIRVDGKLSGHVEARDRITITKTGTVEGEVTTARIAVEDGAVFRGSVNIAKPQDKKPQPVPKAG